MDLFADQTLETADFLEHNGWQTKTIINEGGATWNMDEGYNFEHWWFSYFAWKKSVVAYVLSGRIVSPTGDGDPYQHRVRDHTSFVGIIDDLSKSPDGESWDWKKQTIDVSTKLPIVKNHKACKKLLTEKAREIMINLARNHH